MYLVIFTLAQILKGPSLFNKNYTEIEYPSNLQADFTGSGWISNGLVFIELSNSQYLSKYHFAVHDLKHKTLHVSQAELTRHLETVCEHLAIKYFRSIKRLYFGMASNDNATFLIGSSIVNISPLKVTQEYVNTFPHPYGTGSTLPPV